MGGPAQYGALVRLCRRGQPCEDIELSFAHRVPALGESIDWYGDRFTVTEIDWEFSAEGGRDYAEPFIIARQSVRPGWRFE